MQWLASKMRKWADRIDHAGAPKCTGMTFTFEKYKGIVVHHSELGIPQPGCTLWYLNDAEYEKAHTEAVDPGPWVDWKTMTLRERS